MKETLQTQVRFLGQEDPLEMGMATHSSILAWRIPYTVEPGRLHRVTKSQTRPKRLGTQALQTQSRSEEEGSGPRCVNLGATSPASP